jgi:hypothetical protein
MKKDYSLMKHTASEQLKHDQKIRTNLMKFRSGQTGPTKPIKQLQKSKHQDKQKPFSQVLKEVENMLKEFKRKFQKPVLSPDKYKRK